jgi:hypothetical protein
MPCYLLLERGPTYSVKIEALNKCWKGYKIAKSEWDMKMFHYAKGIRR